MPKTNFCQTDPREDNLKLLITFYMDKQHMETNKELSQKVHLTAQTIGNYRRDPYKMQLGSLIKIADALHIPAEDMAKALKGKPLRLDSESQ